MIMRFDKKVEEEKNKRPPVILYEGSYGDNITYKYDDKGTVTFSGTGELGSMLNTALNETKRQYPTLIGDKLLVLAALNLCAEQIEMQQAHQQELDRYQEQVSATVDVISKVIGQP